MRKGKKKVVRQGRRGDAARIAAGLLAPVQAADMHAPARACTPRVCTPRVKPARLLASTILAGLALAPAAYANPVDGVVVAGSASISASGAKLDVVQASDRAVIDWRGFDIGAGEHTQFAQPSASSIALNRVNSNAPSKIDGRLSANGQVVVVNQSGILLGKTAQVDVSGLIATTADIDNDKFMAGGTLAFDKPGKANAAIVNEGSITAREAGLVGLVAPNVVNSGVITAKLGKVHLASGDTATVDLYGDKLLEVAVSDQVTSQLIANTGVIQADGGSIAITAAAGAQVVNSLVSVSGSLQAQSVSEHNGKIEIVAYGSNAVKDNTASAKGIKTGSSNVLVSGMLDASGRKAGERGGSITVTGDNVALLAGTIIDASGHTGASGTTTGKLKSDKRNGSAGGEILIGGDYLGQGTTATAKNLYVSSGALILNDSLSTGDAGRSIFWSDNDTSFYGAVYARALGGKAVDSLTWDATTGGNTGDGGFVETSGHAHLNAGGYVNLTSSNGARGTYFLDPTDITIYGNVDPSFVSTDSSIDLGTNLGLWLDATDVSSVITESGSRVISWNDKSGHGINFTADSGTGYRPSYTGTINGVAALAFNNNRLQSPIFNIDYLSYFTVTNPNADPRDYQSIFRIDSSGFDPSLYKMGTNNNYNEYYRNMSTAPGTGAAGTPVMLGLIFGSTSTSMLLNGATAATGSGVTYTPNNTYIRLGSDNYEGCCNQFYNGNIGEFIAYNATLSTDAQAIVNQYQSAKWGIALTPPGTGVTEADKAMASDGYSVFTTRYLERLSQSADISLQASNNITLDFKGDTLALASGRNFTLTAGNDILTASAGTIQTSGSGNVTFTAGYDIDFSHDFTIASGVGTRTLTAARDIIFDGAITATGGNWFYVNAGRNLDINAAMTTNHNTNLIAGIGGGGDITVNANVTGNQHLQLQAMNDLIIDNATVTGNLRLWASNNDGSGTNGMLIFNNAVLNTNGNFLYMTSGSKGGIRPDFVLDNTTVTSDLNDLLVVGFDDFTISKTLASLYNINIYDTDHVTINNAITVTGNGGGQGFEGISGISLNANVTKTGATGIISFNGPLTVSGNRSISVAGGILNFNGTIDGANAGADSLAVNSGASTNAFSSPIGSNIALNNFSLIADSFTLGGGITAVGTVTLAPNTQSTTVGFSGGAGTLQITQAMMDAINTLTVTIGRADSTGLLTTGAYNWNSTLTNLNLLGGNITVDGNITSGSSSGSQDKALTLKANNDILINSNRVISSSSSYGKLHTVLNSDADASGAGAIMTATYPYGVGIYSNSGDITMGGGANPLTDAAYGNAVNTNGIALYGVVLDAGGGSISLRGEGYAGAAAQGLYLLGNNISTTGSGTIMLNGTGNTTNGTGIELNGGILRTVDGDLTIQGTGFTGIDGYFKSAVTVQATGTGNLSLTGNGQSGGYGIALHSNSGHIFSTNSGDITVNGTTAAGTASNYTGLLANASFASTSGDIFLSGSASSIGGVNVNGIWNWSTLNAQTGGNITLTGTVAGSGSGQTGIRLEYGTLSNAGSGDITLNGTGNLTDGTGILLNSSTLSTVDGDLNIQGTGFTGINSYFTSQIVLQATGTGNISVTGNGASGGAGIMLYAPNIHKFITNSGNIALNGLTTAGSATGYFGLFFANTDIISASGNISLTGSASSSGNGGVHGIGTGNFTNIQTGGSGIITLTGTAGGTGLYHSGININATGANFISNTSDIIFNTDALQMSGPNTIQTTGTVFFRPTNQSTTVGFSGGAGTLQITQAIMDVINASTVTIGRSDSTSLLTTGSYSWNSTLTNLNLLGGDITVDGNITSGSGSGTQDKTLTLKSNNDIVVNANKVISSSSTYGKLHTILNSDADANQAGAIMMNSGSGILSNGGNIILGGGANPLTGYAYGSSTNNAGIKLSDATLSSGSGDITLHGKEWQGAGLWSDPTNVLIGIHQNGAIKSTDGNISIYAGMTNAGSGYRSAYYSNSSSSLIESVNGDITLNADGGSHAIDNRAGIVRTTGTGINAGNITLNGTNSIDTVNLLGSFSIISTIDGNIMLNGTSTSRDMAIHSGASVKATGDGNVTFNALGSGVFNPAGGAPEFGSNTSTGDYIFNIGEFWLNTAPIIQTSGSVIFRPRTANTTIGVGGSTGTLQITSAMLDAITASNITIGRADGMGLLRMAGLDLSARNYGLSLVNGSGNIQYDGGALTLAANKSFSTAATSGMFTTSANGSITTSGIGTISIDDPLALGANLALNADNAGSINFGGTVNGGHDLSASAGSIGFNGAWGNVTPLGAVSLTSVNDITLPAMTAASIFARTTGTGSDITLGGNLFASATSGTSLTLASHGDLFNPFASTIATTAGSRWLIYSDTPANNSLGGITGSFNRYGCTYAGGCASGASLTASGNGLIYQYRPTLTITPNALPAFAYGDAAPSLVNYAYTLTGYLADEGADTITGSLTGSTLYAQGANAGSYGISYLSGTLISALGYQFAYAGNPAGITVLPKPQMPTPTPAPATTPQGFMIPNTVIRTSQLPMIASALPTMAPLAIANPTTQPLPIVTDTHGTPIQGIFTGQQNSQAGYDFTLDATSELSPSAGMQPYALLAIDPKLVHQFKLGSVREF